MIKKKFYYPTDEFVAMAYKHVLVDGWSYGTLLQFIEGGHRGYKLKWWSEENKELKLIKEKYLEIAKQKKRGFS